MLPQRHLEVEVDIAVAAAAQHFGKVAEARPQRVFAEHAQGVAERAVDRAADADRVDRAQAGDTRGGLAYVTVVDATRAGRDIELVAVEVDVGIDIGQGRPAAAVVELHVLRIERDLEGT